MQMGSIQNIVYYCCVAKGNRVLYAYSGGDQEIEALVAVCLERTPPFHIWYFETVGQRTYGFLMEDGYVYFTIADEVLGNSGVLRFLEHVRDGFKKVVKNGSRSNLAGSNPICLEEQLVPIIRRLISSLENVSRSEPADWMAERPAHQLSPSQFNNQMGNSEAAASTKAPLLGKPSKHEKKKMKDRLAETRDVISEDHRKSTDRGIKIDVAPESNQGSVSSISLQKSSSSTRIRGQQQARRMWWRHVRMVLAIDAVVCLVLFGIWLGICHGFHCIH
ncbi:phytolongin Phyl1.1-like [Magnolia sinica]|uniref:phytolongin Phyl1.1-like n=1 Tax=Magnolia sinica TaxID=86752 RepID=UPI00265AADA7|nr:phytolongin Phyl1.1-like [Magnolia sinica]XP_058097558.1 phytolongin Phyl1.1-like [Magnolia sinica]